jgi:DNA-binding MarR family transcriptional regulator
LDLPDPVVIETDDACLRVRLPESQPASFLVTRVSSLTRPVAQGLVGEADDRADARLFVSYRRASAEGRDVLRAAGVSFAGDDGRAFIRAPGMLVDRDLPVRRAATPRWDLDVDERVSARNPFAKRSSRVPRWLLLHHDQSFAVGELAADVDLHPAAVSRVIRALEDAALVRDVEQGATGRRRSVRLERPQALLDAWLVAWERRRVRHRRWDIGARDPQHAVALVRESVGERAPWALGGLAGAALVRRVVEPADALLWVQASDVPVMAEALQPEPTRGGRGTLRVAVAPDEWTLGQVSSVHGVPVADTVQLWLDTASEGERALEAAAAIAEHAGWS